jgi:hypothetical protein
MSVHLEHEWLERYARGELDQARSFSVEAHLPACEPCRTAIAGLVDAGRLSRTWDAIDLAIDAPVPGPVERLLRRTGVPDHTARLLALTPSLRPSWLLAVAVVLAFGAVAADWRGETGLMAFLLVAPLLPLAGVAVAYGPHVDPAHEVAIAAPAGTLRVLLLRTVAVVVATTTLAAVAAATLPGFEWTAAAWLVPSLGLTLAALGLATSTGAAAACTIVAATWVCAVLAAWRVEDDPLTAFGGFGQLACLLAALAGAALVIARRDTFETRSQA